VTVARRNLLHVPVEVGKNKTKDKFLGGGTPLKKEKEIRDQEDRQPFLPLFFLPPKDERGGGEARRKEE